MALFLPHTPPLPSPLLTPPPPFPFPPPPLTVYTVNKSHRRGYIIRQKHSASNILLPAKIDEIVLGPTYTRIVCNKVLLRREMYQIKVN